MYIYICVYIYIYVCVCLYIYVYAYRTHITYNYRATSPLKIRTAPFFPKHHGRPSPRPWLAPVSAWSWWSTMPTWPKVTWPTDLEIP